MGSRAETNATGRVEAAVNKGMFKGVFGDDRFELVAEIMAVGLVCLRKLRCRLGELFELTWVSECTGQGWLLCLSRCRQLGATGF